MDDIDKHLDILFDNINPPEDKMLAVDKTVYDILKSDPYFIPMCGDEVPGIGDS